MSKAAEHTPFGLAGRMGQQGAVLTSFEFAFSLYGLVLGLCVTEVISGFARVLRARKAIRLGWLTPALGILLLVDLVTFWANAWQLREFVPATFGTLLFGTVVAGIYFLSASLVFPGNLNEWSDLDDYFLLHKGQVILGVIVANLIVFAGRIAVVGGGGPIDFAVAATFTGLGAVLFFARKKWLCGAALAVLLSLYVILRLI